MNDDDLRDLAIVSANMATIASGLLLIKELKEKRKKKNVRG
jgi:hypothetical protein